MKIQRPTATEVDQETISLLGGRRFEGVSFTNDQYEALYRHYGFDNSHVERCVQDSIRASEERYEEAVKRHKEKSWQPPPEKPNHNQIRRGNEAIINGGDELAVFRAARDDGLRVMAFLSRYLEEDEDPVNLVAEALSHLGYDVMMDDLWTDIDDEEWNEECAAEIEKKPIKSITELM